MGQPLEGEDLTTTAFPGLVTIAAFDSTTASTPLIAEIPLHGFTILHMPMTERRSCVGLRTTRWNTASGGVVTGFIRVAEAKTHGYLFPLLSVDSTLCSVIAGDLTGGTNCDTTPQAMWPTPPDSLCTDTTCVANTRDTIICDPATPEGSTGTGGRPGCNAWNLLAQFVAQGVEII